MISLTVKNLGVIFDQDLSFNSYVKQISRSAFFPSVTLLKSGLNKMQKNLSMHLLLQGWTTVILYFQVALTQL